MKPLLKKSYLLQIMFAVCMSLILHQKSSAQTSINILSGTSVNSTTGIYVSGSITNAGLVKNKDTVTIKGNIINSPGGIYDDSGTHIFNGSADQTIEGVKGSSSLGNVEKNNPPGVDLVLKDTTNMKTLKFGPNPGLVDGDTWGNATLYITSYAYDAITNADSNRYVFVTTATTSSLSLNCNDTVTGHEYLSPIGNGTVYRGNAFQYKSMGASGSTTLETSVVPGSGGSINQSYPTTYGSVGFTYLQTEPVRVFLGDNDLIFEAYLNPSGTPSGYTGQRVLLSPITINDFSNNVMSYAYGNVDSNVYYLRDMFNSLGFVRGAFYQTVDSFDMNVGSYFTNPLPVELKYVLAKPIDNSYIQLTWGTVSELNCKEFQVERSANNQSFEYIGTVNGNRNSNSPRDYSINDYAVEKDTYYYYRIKQVDFDGKTTYFPIVEAHISSSGNLPTTLMPSLTKGMIFPSNNNFSKIEIYDIGGKIIGTITNNDTYFDLSTFAKGMYLCRILSKNDSDFSIQKIERQ